MFVCAVYKNQRKLEEILHDVSECVIFTLWKGFKKTKLQLSTSAEQMKLYITPFRTLKLNMLKNFPR
jgi:hypothetical protein